MSEQLKHLIDELKINRDQAVKVDSGGDRLHHSFEVDPRDFLDQAERDFEAGGNSTLLNSITNSKRAIHCQVDQALRAIGIESTNMNLPEKVRVMEETGFIFPRILKKVNQERNLLEHEYQRPDEKIVEEALDLAILFIETTNRRLDTFWHEFYVGNESRRIDTFTFFEYLSFKMIKPKISNRDRPAFEVVGMQVSSDGREIVDTVIVEPDEDISRDIVNLANTRDREAHVHKALERFFEELGC